MKYLKLYESFDNSDMKDLEDIFSLVIHDVQIEKIPYYYFNSDCKPDFYIYIIYGYLKNILSDREFLRELYGFNDILKNVYNKEYYYINLKRYPIIVLYDYLYSDKKNYINFKKYFFKNIDKKTKIPSEISYILNKNEDLGRGIDYSDGSSSNLSLFDWIYEPKKKPNYDK